MIEVNLPDGRTVRFPEGTNEQQIKSKINQMMAVEEEGPTLPEETFTQPDPAEMQEVEQNMPRFETETEYTPSSVLQDENAMSAIREYMYSFHGTPTEITDEELVDQYLAKMRKFSAGQSVVTLDEIMQLKKADKDKLQVAGQAYDIFDNFEGVFSGDYTWGETFDGLGTYARAVIVDPTNLAGVGLGRLIAGGSTKAGSLALKRIAQEAFERSIKRELTKKVGEKTAKKVLEEGTKGATQRAALSAAQQTARVAERKAMEKAAKSSAVSTALKSQAKKEIAIATGVDTALAVGIDYAYQQGMIMTGRQEEWSPFQSGLTALGTLGAGMITAGLQLTNKQIGKKTASVLDAYQGYDFTLGQVKDSASKLAQDDTFLPDIEETFTKFSERVAAGRAVTEEGDLLRGVNEQEFFRYLMLGNDAMGVKGLADKFVEAGIDPPRPRYVGDNITSYMADALENLPSKQKDEFVSLFREHVGKHLPDYENASMKDIANLMAYQTSVAGQQLQVFSEVSKRLKFAGIDPETGTLKEALDTLNPSMGRVTLRPQKALEDKPRSIDFYQNTLIQTIVSHPGTTALNIKGSLARGLLDTTADVVQGALYTAIGTRGFVTGNTDDMVRGMKMIQASGRRFSRLLAPDATAKEVENYLSIRPEAEKTLFRFLSGGVENEDVLKAFNMDKAGVLNQKFANAITTYKDFAQKLYLVQFQDRLFKTQNFMYSLDKRIAQQYGKSYAEFMADPSAAKIMQTPEYSAVEMKAVEDTLLSVFSKSYSSKEALRQNPIHWAATTIEDVRKVPIVGAALPFGQFFNGTIDFMADYSSAKFLYRLAGAGEGRTMEGLTEAASKGAVGLGAIYALASREEQFIDMGLAWNEQLSEDGSIVSKEYDFPESFFKMVARGVAHYRRDGSVPAELQEQFATTFGLESFTRNIQGSAQEIAQSFGVFMEGDLAKGAEELVKVAGTEVVAAWLSGYTRPIDPVNQMAGLTREDGTLVLDRKQGIRTLNESFRYVDQIFGDVLLSLGSEEKAMATQEEPVGEIGKLFGYRTVPAQSNTQKMMNAIDKPEWKASFYTDNDRLNNRLNELIFKHIEPQATLLVRNPKWDKMSVDEKRRNIRQAWTVARERAKEELSMSPLVEDAQLSAINEVLSKASQRELDRAKDYLGMDKELSEYNSAQIRSLLFTLEKIKRGDLMAPYE